MSSVASAVTLASLAELQSWVDRLAVKLSHKQLILISGPMGAGKTEFVRALARNLKVTGVSSPTYAIHQRYVGRNGDIDHLDLYRLEDTDDLESIGFWDLFNKERGLILVEWADRLDQDAWPKDWPTWRIDFVIDENGLRSLFFTEA